jgi:hypothetical protein
MPKPYPKEFRQDVVRVARNREPGQTLKQIAADFGISGEAGMGVGGNHVLRSKRRASCPRHRLHHPGRNPLG